MNIQYINICDLVLLERNPRKITKDQFKKLCNSLEEDPAFLDARPILVNRVDDKNIVYAGNQRVQAAKKLKWKNVPCIVYNDLDEKTIKSRIVKDNAHYGEFDYDILYADYEIQMLEDSGFTPEQLTGDCGDIQDLDYDEKSEKDKKEKVKSCCPNCGHEF